MKILLEHELPRRLRYAKVYLELGNSSLFVLVDGSRASWYGSIGGKKTSLSVSDREYARYRAASPATELVDQDEGRVILRNKEGNEEEWATPRWIMTGFRRQREKQRNPPKLAEAEQVNPI